MSQQREATSDDSAVSMLLDDQLCFALYSATHRIQRRYRPMLQELGLTYPQYLVLLVLWEEREISVSQIGDRLFLDSATVTPLLKRMESAGLIERRRSVRDERRVEVSLTSKGVALQAEVQRITSDVTCAAAEASEAPAQLLQALVELRNGLTRNETA